MTKVRERRRVQVVDDGAQAAEIEQQVEGEQNSANLAVFSDLGRILALLYSSSSLTSANVAAHLDRNFTSFAVSGRLPRAPLEA